MALAIGSSPDILDDSRASEAYIIRIRHHELLDHPTYWINM
jgi:hypothetical protein